MVLVDYFGQDIVAIKVRDVLATLSIDVVVTILVEGMQIFTTIRYATIRTSIITTSCGQVHREVTKNRIVNGIDVTDTLSGGVTVAPRVTGGVCLLEHYYLW